MTELAGLELLRALDEGVAARTGAEFFPSLVKALAEALQASCAFASEFDHEGYRVDVRAFYCDQAFVDPFTYPLSGSPCECVLDGEIVAFANNIQDMFPAERDDLAAIGAQSYLAIPIIDTEHKVHGHLAVIDRRARDWSEADRSILRIFSTRAAAEFQRIRDEQRLAAVNAALRESNAELRREVAMRLEMQAALEVAKQAAEGASEAKSRFLAHMSHELRTPLNGILGYAQLLQRDRSLTREQRASVGIIEESGEHLLTMINDLLDLAKIEAGRFDAHAREFDLPRLVRHVTDVAAVRARHAGLNFVVDIASDLPNHVRGCDRALRQILLNLLSNAVKFTRSGEITLRARHVRAAAQRDQIEIEVEDTGVGISPEHLATIFEPFERGAHAGTAVEGAGLGLAISRRLSDAIGADLSVTSTVDRGTRFKLTTDLEVIAAPAVSLGPDVTVIGYAGQRRTVVVADDEIFGRQLIAKLLEGLGFQVREAANGLEALKLARELRPDLLITDLSVPLLDGLQTMRAARTDPSLKQVPIIVVSASTSEYSREDVLEAGATNYLIKPINIDNLLAELGSVLDLAWIAAESADTAAPASAAALDEPMPKLEPRWAAELRDLAMKGEVRTLIERVEAAIAEDPNAAATYQRILHSARSLDMKRVRQMMAESSA
jgi:signal transduction histidine kinase/DNA-binding NarL/FixJ family response regulator